MRRVQSACGHNGAVFIVQVALSWHQQFTGFGGRGLTLPSRGRSKGRFAPFGPPLMSNVRPAMYAENTRPANSGGTSGAVEFARFVWRWAVELRQQSRSSEGTDSHFGFCRAVAQS